MHSHQSTVSRPTEAQPRTPLAAAVARRFSVLSVRRTRVNAQRREDRLAHLDLDQRVRESGEW